MASWGQALKSQRSFVYCQKRPDTEYVQASFQHCLSWTEEECSVAPPEQDTKIHFWAELQRVRSAKKASHGSAPVSTLWAY